MESISEMWSYLQSLRVLAQLAGYDLSISVGDIATGIVGLVAGWYAARSAWRRTWAVAGWSFRTAGAAGRGVKSGYRWLRPIPEPDPLSPLARVILIALEGPLAGSIEGTTTVTAGKAGVFGQKIMVGEKVVSDDLSLAERKLIVEAARAVIDRDHARHIANLCDLVAESTRDKWGGFDTPVRAATSNGEKVEEARPGEWVRK